MAQLIEPARQDLINWILEMKNGNEKCTPQPDYARNRMLQLAKDWPELDLLNGIKQALEQK